MLNPAAIEAYLAKRRDNYDWLKDATPKEISDAFNEAFDSTLTHLGLWQHQKVALLLLAEIKRFLLFIDMGGGKTLTSLSLIKALKAKGEPHKAIVFVPYVTSVMTWVDECKKFTPDLNLIPLIWDTKENLSLLKATKVCGSSSIIDVYVICYQSAVALFSDCSGPKWRLDVDLIRSVLGIFNVSIFDEIHKCKDAQSLTYRMCRVISARTEYALGLTGTPFGRELQDLWPQFYLIDHGETLGPTLGFYREVFFTQKKRYWGKGYDYTFRKKLLPELQRIIRQRSIHYPIEELVDLPGREYVTKTIRCPSAAQGYVDQGLSQLKTAIIDGARTQAEGAYLQLRQLSSGFMTVLGDKKVQIEFDDNPKLDALTELVEELPPGCKMVIFHHFVYTNEIISKRLKQMGVNHARVWGGNSKNLEELGRFQNDPGVQALVINTRSGSSSLNLQHANYVVFFEQPDSPIDRQQAERRVWRPGQTQRVIYYDLLVEGTVDRRLHESNLAGKSLLQDLLRGGKL